MNKKHVLVLVAAIALIIISLYFVIPGKEVAVENTYPASQNYTLASISVLGPSTKIGQYDVEGFVTDTYTCPLCPAGAACKPCAGNSVTLSEKVGAPGITVLVNDSRLFEVGAKYRFSVESSGPDNYPNLRLVGFDRLSAVE